MKTKEEDMAEWKEENPFAWIMMFSNMTMEEKVKYAEDRFGRL